MFVCAYICVYMSVCMYSCNGSSALGHFTVVTCVIVHLKTEATSTYVCVIHKLSTDEFKF